MVAARREWVISESENKARLLGDSGPADIV